MRQGLDFEKAEAALKRAAEKATRGTRDERSGRFEKIQQPRSSSNRIERAREKDFGSRDKWRKP